MNDASISTRYDEPWNHTYGSLNYGFQDDQLVLGDTEEAPDMSLADLLNNLLIEVDDEDELLRILNMGLALMTRITRDREFSEIHRLDLFGSCLWQAERWEKDHASDPNHG
jgi:hypothetical protein